MEESLHRSAPGWVIDDKGWVGVRRRVGSLKWKLHQDKWCFLCSSASAAKPEQALCLVSHKHWFKIYGPCLCLPRPSKMADGCHIPLPHLCTKSIARPIHLHCCISTVQPGIMNYPKWAEMLIYWYFRVNLVTCNRSISPSPKYRRWVSYSEPTMSFER